MYLALSLTANNITAKLTYNSTRTGLSTFDSQQLFTRLWFPLTLSKRQSPPTTKVLLRTTPTRTIALHFHMLFLPPPPPPRFKSFTVNRPFYSSQRHIGNATAHTWERGWAWLVLNLCERFWWNSYLGSKIVRFLRKMDGPSRNLDKANFSPKKKGK